MRCNLVIGRSNNYPDWAKSNKLDLRLAESRRQNSYYRQPITPSARQALANQLQIHVRYVNKWVALADLARIPSVGCEYCGLLLHSGIVSISQLVQTPVHRLHQQFLRLHVATMQRQDLCPSINVVQKWATEARSLIQRPPQATWESPGMYDYISLLKIFDKLA